MENIKKNQRLSQKKKNVNYLSKRLSFTRMVLHT